MKLANYILPFILLLLCISCRTQKIDNETLASLNNSKAPQTVEELWASYDPRKEPLETEILYEWEEEDVVVKALRYRAGIFKGEKAMIAAVYGYPGRKT